MKKKREEHHTNFGVLFNNSYSLMTGRQRSCSRLENRHFFNASSHRFFHLINLLIFAILFISHHIVGAALSFDFSERPQNLSVRAGERVVLRCAAPPSNTIFDSQSQWRANTGALLNFYDSGILPGYGGHYSYTKDRPGELHLQIDNVSLADDGKFECQMLRPLNKFLRAAAFVNVLNAPTEISFLNYKADETIEVHEESTLNVTCSTGNAKPEPEMNIFVNGKRIADSLYQWNDRFDNGTVNSFSSLIWRPTKKDHNKLLSCEVNHLPTNTNLQTSVTLNVLYSSDRPRISLVSDSENGNLKAGKNVTLICSAEGGNPPPHLVWSNQAGLINSTYQYDVKNQITQNTYSFVVQGLDNNAVYECSSSNRENIAPLKKTITLKVDFAPGAVYLYGSTTVRKGDSVIVSCFSGVSSPAATIAWKINESPTRHQPQTEKQQAQGFVTESNITIDSNILLSGQNQITVECLASNNEGPSPSNQHIIRVLSPPSLPVIYEPPDQDSSAFLEGGLLNLTCEAQDGHPLATLNWYRGVEKLKEAYGSNEGDMSRSVVSIQLDRSMNQQQIRCEAENGATDQPLVAKKFLSVLFPPSHIKIHQMEGFHHHMVANVAYRLICHVPSSNPPAEIIWEFENRSSVGTSLPKIAKFGQYTKRSNRPTGEYKGYEVENMIQFVPTEDMDKSIVRCIASHPQWNTIKASSFTLDVMYLPRVAVEGPITIVVGEGESFEENLTINANPRVSNFQWRKNGVSIERNSDSIYVRGATIGGKFISKEDSGIYMLNAANRIGTTNVTLKLIVEYSARVIYITSPVIASVGEDVVLECEADGVPLKQGMVKWMRGNTEIKSVVQDQKRAVLRLNASYQNGGVYTCVANNGIGQPNSTMAYLLVRRMPVILRTPEFNRAAGPIGGRATLKCRAIGVPNVEFSWGIEGDGQMLTHNTSKYKFSEILQLDHATFQSTLTILKLDERDYVKNYRCRASNRLGLVQTTITVGPLSAPDVPLELQVVNVTDTSVSLAWIPGFDGGSNQIFELRYLATGDSEMKSMNSSGSRISIGGLKVENAYRVQIRSINSLGRVSEFSSPLQFHTLDENLQGVYRVTADTMSSVLSPPAMLAILTFFVVLLTLNLILVCLCRRRQKQKKYQEKTEIARTLNHTNDGLGRPIQIYGTLMGNGTLSNCRPDSMNTNKSELPNEQLTSEDNQSARTIIEVNQNGYIMANSGIGNDQNYYDAHCIENFYSPINKPLLGNGTYASVPYPEPPLNGTNPLLYSKINNVNGSRLTLEPSPSPHRHTFNRINGYNTLKSMNGADNNNTVLLVMDQNPMVKGNGGTGNYVVTGAYNPHTNSLTFSGNNSLMGNDGGGLIVSNAPGNYDSLRSYHHASANSTLNNNRSPRMLSTFANNNYSAGGQGNIGYMMDAAHHNEQQQHLMASGDDMEGDIV